MAIAICIVTSYLQTKRSLIAMVSIMHIILICGEMRIPTPLLNVWCAVLDNQLIGTLISEGHLTGKKLRATRAVHNRAAACVAAGGCIFENQY
jgi:hypothetical protein